MLEKSTHTNGEIVGNKKSTVSKHEILQLNETVHNATISYANDLLLQTNGKSPRQSSITPTTPKPTTILEGVDLENSFKGILKVTND